MLNDECIFEFSPFYLLISGLRLKDNPTLIAALGELVFSLRNFII